MSTLSKLLSISEILISEAQYDMLRTLKGDSAQYTDPLNNS